MTIKGGLTPIHPGEFLGEALEELATSQALVARTIEVSPMRVSHVRALRPLVAQMPQPPSIREGRTTQACYRRRSDSIEMPAFARFNTPEDFHITLFHELIHATGHESREQILRLAVEDQPAAETQNQAEDDSRRHSATLSLPFHP